MQKATGNHCSIFPQDNIKTEKTQKMDFRIEQTINSQMLRIPQIYNSIKRLGTWNVRNLCPHGKFQNLTQEIDRPNVEIIGVNEQVHHDANNYSMYYLCGDDEAYHERYGVGMVMNAKVKKTGIEFYPLSDRVIMLSLDTRPVILNVIYIYALRADKPQEEVKDLFKDQQTYEINQKGGTNNIKTDSNAEVGRGNTVGTHGLGKRNYCIDMFIGYLSRMGPIYN